MSEPKSRAYADDGFATCVAPEGVFQKIDLRRSMIQENLGRDIR